MARPAAGAGERRLRGPLRAVVQGGLRRPAAPLPAHPPDRAGERAASGHGPLHHRDRVRDRMEQPGNLRAHLPGRHWRESRRAPGAREGRTAPARTGAGLHPPRRPPAGPHNRSFGEAAAGCGRYDEWVRRKGGPMSQGVGVVGLYVRDQEEARQFYVEKLGFRVHTDARNGDYRWLTVQHPEQPSFQLGLFTPQAPLVDAATAQTLREIVAKGAMPPLVLVVDDCRAAYERMHSRGVEFTQEPVDRYGSVDASFRDPSGNGWKLIEARRAPAALS